MNKNQITQKGRDYCKSLRIDLAIDSMEKSGDIFYKIGRGLIEK